jgi:hypothetical protein
LHGESLHERLCAPATRYPPRANRPQVEGPGPSIKTRGGTLGAGCLTGRLQNAHMCRLPPLALGNQQLCWLKRAWGNRPMVRPVVFPFPLAKTVYGCRGCV